jgi:hypothetical protein
MFYLAKTFHIISTALKQETITKISDNEEKSTKSLIPKLDDLNYPSWSVRMRAYLCSKDLWEICTGKVTPAKKKRNETLNAIISHLSEEALDATVTPENEENPALLWASIVEQYASSSVNKKARIWLKWM